MTTSIDPRLLARQPGPPVGAYSYSGGLEAAVEAGIVKYAASAQQWIGDVLEFAVGRMEAPVLLRMMAGEVGGWNELFLASRETAELRAETLQMGYSLNRLLPELGLSALELEEISFPAAFAHAAAAGRSITDALTATRSWAENQVMAAIKAVPLGQTDGQRAGPGNADRADRPGRVLDREPRQLRAGAGDVVTRHEAQYSAVPLMTLRGYRRAGRLGQDGADAVAVLALRGCYNIAVVTNDIYTRRTRSSW
jgi:urease accessory protein